MKNRSANSILIMGAQGMLGRPVARRLVQDGFQVRGLARNAAKAKKVLPPSVEVLEGNLESIESIDKALQDCGSVYVSVDTLPGAQFRPETDGLKNVVRAAKNHQGIRLLVLSALRGGDPRAKDHPWWHAREKYEAHMIAKNSWLSYSIFEPTWFMESIPLLIKGNILALIQTKMAPHWIAGDDLGRMISAALKKNIGQNQVIPVQGPTAISLEEAARRFIDAYDPRIRAVPVPMWVLRAVGIFHPVVRELPKLFDLFKEIPEDSPDPTIWEKFAKPQMTIEGYAGYVKGSGDFPQK